MTAERHVYRGRNDGPCFVCGEPLKGKVALTRDDRYYCSLSCEDRQWNIEEQERLGLRPRW